MHTRTLFFALAAITSLAACGHGGTADAGHPPVGGGGGGGSGGGGAVDAGDDAGLPDAGNDSGLPDAGWTIAPHPGFPTALALGGPVVAHPKIVPITFPNDPLTSDIDTFVAAIAHTTYWEDRVAEYGIDKPVPLAPIHDPTVQPATVDDSAIQSFLVSHLEDADAGWPKGDGDTLFTFFYPPGTTITENGYSSCATFHGYHFNVTLHDGTKVPYAVVSRCDSLPELPGIGGIDYAAAVASHEVIEALTDPFPYDNPAYAEEDNDHLAWTLAVGGELGDLCALVGDAFYRPNDFDYPMQRIWSNAAAAAGRDPCSPQPGGEPYFNSVPVLDEPVTFTVQGQSYPTQGVKIPVGQSKTIDLDLFSDGPTSQPWSLDAFEYSSDPSHLKFAFDQGSGQNGDVRHLTITVEKKDPAYGAELFVVVSRLGSRTNLFFGLVGN